MKEKLLQLMRDENLTSSRLADLLDVQPSGISHILSGRNKPSFELLQKILRRFPRVSPDWLLLDRGAMYRPEEEPKPTAAHDGANGATPDASTDLFRVGTGRVGFSPIGGEEADAPGTPPAGVHTNAATAPDRSAGMDPTALAALAREGARLKRVILVYTDHTYESLTPRE